MHNRTFTTYPAAVKEAESDAIFGQATPEIELLTGDLFCDAPATNLA